MLTYAMLYMAAVGAPVALGAWAVAAVLRRYGRPERGVWLAALALAIGLPLVLMSRSGGGGSLEVESVATGVLGLPELLAVSEEAAPLGADAYAIVLWALASGLMLARWMIALSRLRVASQEWTPGSIDGVEVEWTSDLGPAVAGILRPRILAPAWIATLPEPKRALVLEHEQQHIRARDPLLVTIARLAHVLLPWNPIAWLLSSRLIRAIELDCDRRVLDERPDVGTYGSTLLDISARRPIRLVGVAAFAESEAPLRSRILAMTTPSRSVSVAAIFASVVLGVVLLVGALEIPVPALGIRIAIGETRPSEAPATPPPFQPSSTRPRLVNEEEVRVVARMELERVTGRDLDVTLQSAAAQEPERPSFTPMSFQPIMLNRPEVARALLEAYPPDLRERGIGGTAILQLRVGTDGRVLDRTVQKSSGYAAMDQAALRVVDLMQFEPARNRDQRVPVWVSQRATFVPGAPANELTDHHGDR